MKPKLTDEMRDAIREAGNTPVEVQDGTTNAEYVLVSKDLFERVRALVVDEEFNIEDTYAAQAEALRGIWDDPELDIYNNYDAHKPPQ